MFLKTYLNAGAVHVRVYLYRHTHFTDFNMFPFTRTPLSTKHGLSGAAKGVAPSFKSDVQMWFGGFVSSQKCW